MNLKEVCDYYSRDDVTNALLSLAKNRETVGVFRNGSFDIRPNVLINPSDIQVMARAGTVEFHCSLEHWSNVMALKSDNYQHVRTGWDIVLDLDCKDLELAKVAAKVLFKDLKKHGISHVDVKFTGNNGLHMGLPWESIPKKVGQENTSMLYPDLARKVAAYLRERATEDLERALLKKWSPEKLSEMSGKPVGSLYSDPDTYTLDPYQVVDIDPILISPRHLFRMPYSLNSKTFLASLPVSPSRLDEFQKKEADPAKFKAKPGFLQSGEEGELELLITEALDWSARKVTNDKKEASRKYVLEKAVPRELFPPCIMHILEGLADGKKRSVFILINFLSSMNWGYDAIERELMEWNAKNNPPLREGYIRGQLSHFKRKGQSALPPNCNNEAYMASFGACKPDKTCTAGTSVITIKNPASYPFKEMKKERGRKK